ncbi:schlafen family member 12-like [Mesocricetus auratus]|uniref:Schlafen family member 12-like n=1 Tax=Mesocricetus auratus TaxID=10036 RepID=A0ABM2XSU1_MESAU|nr:schlafen family member 12-like [Mesocricetus auratus]
MSPGLQTTELGNRRAHGKEIQLENAKAAGEMAITVDLETDYAKLVLYVGAITLGEKNRKKMKNPLLRKWESGNISRAVCALLNSGGGAIKIKIKNENYSLNRDGLGLDLEASLCKCLPFVGEHVDFMEREGYFYIFVKSWSVDVFGLPIGTLRTSLYIRTWSSSVEVVASDALEFLQDLEETGGRSCVRAEPPVSRACPGVEEESLLEDLAAAVFNKTQFQYKEDFPFSRSTYTEVALLSVKELQKHIRELIPRTVSAFANTEGGYLFIGLDAKKQQIIGFEADESDLAHLESKIEECIRQLPVTHFCEEQEKIKYTCKFIQVHRQGAVCSYVCALRVERFCCAVFAAEPDCWHVEGSCVKRFTTEEWVKSLMAGKPGSGTNGA